MSQKEVKGATREYYVMFTLENKSKKDHINLEDLALRLETAYEKNGKIQRQDVSKQLKDVLARANKETTKMVLPKGKGQPYKFYLKVPVNEKLLDKQRIKAKFTLSNIHNQQQIAEAKVVFSKYNSTLDNEAKKFLQSYTAGVTSFVLGYAGMWTFILL